MPGRDDLPNRCCLKPGLFLLAAECRRKIPCVARSWAALSALEFAMQTLVLQVSGAAEPVAAGFYNR